ncbi:MAG: radical SAM protein, partial [Planctomycetaceae bacterium]|nr:radical SAM protein [Planctomycetaceae bacterium]
MNIVLPSPKHFQIQWHLTERCNLRCSHCYQNSYNNPDLPLKSLRIILKQFVETIETFNKERQYKIPAGITLTGGEPFLRTDFFELLEEVITFRKLFRFAILTNGTFIDNTIAKRLRKLKPDYVQVSLDGTKETHETVRGRGSFEPAVEGIRQLVQAGIRTLISFTAGRYNVTDFPAVAQLGVELGVDRIWTDRFIPTTPEQQDASLSPEETKTFFETIRRVRQSLRKSFLYRFIPQFMIRQSCTEISMNRALQFLVGGGTMYHCSAGDSLVAVLPDGTLLPCRRLPIPVGNLLENPLLELYRSSNLFQSLRTSRFNESSSCYRCPFSEGCGGGLRCLAYAITNDSLSGDPACWLRKNSNAVSAY